MNDQQRAAMREAIATLVTVRGRIVEAGGSGWKLEAQRCVRAIDLMNEALAHPQDKGENNDVSAMADVEQNWMGSGAKDGEVAQPQGEWVDLTDDEIEVVIAGECIKQDLAATDIHIINAAITKFKEKNTPPVVPQGEPVACSKDAPVHIYLQTGCDDEYCECAFNDWGDVTWCGEKIHDSDIHYVRADNTPPSVEAAIEATKAKYEKKFDEVFGELIEKIKGGMSAEAAIRSMK